MANKYSGVHLRAAVLALVNTPTLSSSSSSVENRAVDSAENSWPESHFSELWPEHVSR